MDTCSSVFVLQQMVELTDTNCGNSEWDAYNKSTLETSGLHVRLKCGNDIKENDKDLSNNNEIKNGEKN